MNFEYLQTIRKEDSIDISDPGNTYLQAFMDDGCELYLSTATKLGFTTVKTFGPFEEGEQSNCFSYMTYELEYNDKKIYKIINDFLNGRKPKTQVFEITKEEFEEKLNKIKL